MGGRVHPDVVEPAQWTRETCAAWVAALDRMTIGEYVQRRAGVDKRGGEPLSPRTKAGYLTATRTFFRDCQEWEWIPRRFDPVRALATRRSVKALIGLNPRVIADDIWPKLLWAGLNIDPGDFPTNTYGLCYPIELIRAVTLTWLFSGLRSDEIARLAWAASAGNMTDSPSPATPTRCWRGTLSACWTSPPTRPAPRSPSPSTLSWARRSRHGRNSGRSSRRCWTPRPVSRWTSCSRTGPNASRRPTSTPRSSRHSAARPASRPPMSGATSPATGARSTIASQLYNAKEPMTLFELQAWLGHRSPEATQHYAKITPNTLARAYSDAGYFERNVRTIEVLVDRDAVTSGAAASGEPWQYYDLGHGYCTYTFFEQCPHRMACARCDFYTPKGSSKGRLLEAKDNLQRMLASVPLSDEERAAVDDGQAALDQLLERLVDVPTPAGATPREIGVPVTATLLPIVAVNQGKG